PSFWFMLDPTGVHRLQFVDDDGDILQVLDGAVGGINGPGEQLSPLPGCYAALGDVQESLAVAVVLDLATAQGTCATIEGTSLPTTTPPDDDDDTTTPPPPDDDDTPTTPPGDEDGP